MPFETECDSQKAALVRAAVLWAQPKLGHPQREARSLASAALRGWTRLESGLARPPLPHAIAMALVYWRATHARHLATLLLWMVFVTYLRSREALSMCADDIVPPVPLATGMLSQVTVMTCSSATFLATKTVDQDLSILQDSPRRHGLSAPFCRLSIMLAPHQRLWSLSYTQLPLASKHAQSAFGAGILGASPHALRHGGASRDRQTAARSLALVQLRTAWRATSTLQRYEKRGVIAKKLAELPHGVVDKTNLATQILLSGFERIFAPLSGRSQEPPKSSSTSSLVRVACQGRYENWDMPASSSTSCEERTLTSPISRSSTSSKAGFVRGWSKPY